MTKNQLSRLQKDVLAFFGRNLFAKKFYWTGGTLLAYRYLHHRTSMDLDFFSDDLFSENEYLIFINRLKKEIKAGKITLTQEYNRRIYFIKKGRESIKIELVYFPFPAIEKRVKLPEFSFKADSLADIMVNKTLSIYQRKEPKDVFDLYLYLTGKPRYNLFKLIKLVEKKFGVAIEPVILLAKINKLSDDLNILKPLLSLPQKNLNKKVKSFFQDVFNVFARRQIK